MSTEARAIISQWRKEINAYRKTSKVHVRKYITLMEKCNDNEKENLIDIFGKFYILETISMIRDFNFLTCFFRFISQPGREGYN